ncbi:MAG TPA: PilX N-terminal domain-containing pilus assembly protein [Steroidobacteraceae bacterium]|nr:PilX N-terminal domain-containing pilus assembly protein [Steroidobacteraceae bacterium]
MRPFKFQSGHPAIRQRGAILVTSMLLLLVLTIIGVTVMQMSRMQERMAGNSRDINLAFQAAEGSLRAAESFIDDEPVRPVTCASTLSETCKVLAEGTVTGTTGNQDEEWWEDNGQTYDQETMDGLSEAPTAVVEELGYVRTDGGVVMGQDPPDGRDFYQVTARSTGGSGMAEVVLQSTFTRKF